MKKSMTYFTKADNFSLVVKYLCLTATFVLLTSCSGEISTISSQDTPQKTTIQAEVPTIPTIVSSTTPLPTKTVEVTSTAQISKFQTRTPTPLSSPTVTLTPMYQDMRIDLSPGVYFGFVSNENEVYLLPLVNAATPILLARLPSDKVYTIGLSPDQDKLVFNYSDFFAVFNIDTGQITPLKKPDKLFVVSGVDWFTSEIISYSALFEIDDFESIYLYSLATQENTRLTPWRGAEVLQAWSPDRKRLIFTSDHAKFAGGPPVGHQPYIMETSCIDKPEDWAQQSVLLGDYICWSYSWSPDSQSIASMCNIDGIRGIYTFDVHNPAPNLVMTFSNDDANKLYHNLVWLPDGQLFAFNYKINNDANADIMVVPVEGGDIVNITNTPDESDDIMFLMEIK